MGMKQKVNQFQRLYIFAQMVSNMVVFVMANRAHVCRVFNLTYLCRKVATVLALRGNVLIPLQKGGEHMRSTRKDEGHDSQKYRWNVCRVKDYCTGVGSTVISPVCCLWRWHES